jgi:hypothetical protein
VSEVDSTPASFSGVSGFRLRPEDWQF